MNVKIFIIFHTISVSIKYKYIYVVSKYISHYIYTITVLFPAPWQYYNELLVGLIWFFSIQY